MNSNAATPKKHTVVIVGGGAAGISVAASLHRRDHSLDLAVIEPASVHHYQPGWTLVGGGVFREKITARPMSTVMPDFVQWYRQAVQALDPDQHRVQLSDGRWLAYDILVLAPGLELNWGAIDGLEATLGQNGVTSNYQQGLARYTWDLVQQLRQGRALFSQPPMPIKCAGAPQKAMYLSCDHWRRQGVLGNIDVQFHNAGAVLFGVAAYVPALEAYVRRYGIDLNFQSNLVAVNGPARTATFRHTDAEGNSQDREVTFDLLHAVPPQRAPAFIRTSTLANGDGWLDLEDDTLRHRRYANVFGLGDVSGTGNAKTAAAVRKQAPVVAENLIATLRNQPLRAAYLGYGSCPLTVERGRIVLAEFGYGGTLQPTFPKWINDGTQATRAAWWLKAKQLPTLYWHGMLKGHEWLARPARRG
ncbi:FAD/NAD(P)-binding oxidoreductase [uncultured Marinobacter sp.]|jgi:sulfide:quinone oxidoreductase|uniref:NAD(P)/FAD-dependent oxidoreductase n=1 Tax=uncultured Marinobacter sp. TaxID=187379 RepID=UPI000C3A2029|nr:pyridine nucleotide-disulfide oxidoreductase [Oceanospirillales bacterium]|tara:strand:+ start:10966 stop:12216 length:1251 start_codon:yes stop_codon:yes gene_type:complete